MKRYEIFMLIISFFLVYSIGHYCRENPTTLRPSVSEPETEITVSDYDPPFEDPSGIDTVRCSLVWDKEDIVYPEWKDSLEVEGS